MYARVATFEDGEPETVSATIAEIDSEAAAGPPPGVPAVGLLILQEPQGGKVLAITLFATEEDLRAGDAALSAMDPSVPGGMGRRVSVEHFTVGSKIDL